MVARSRARFSRPPPSIGPSGLDAGHATTRPFHAAALWWLFQRRQWPDRLADAGARLRCSRCGRRGTPLELTRDPPTIVDLPLPNDVAWRRAVSRFRAILPLGLGDNRPAPMLIIRHDFSVPIAAKGSDHLTVVGLVTNNSAKAVCNDRDTALSISRHDRYPHAALPAIRIRLV
jgi:hypothetical protein